MALSEFTELILDSPERLQQQVELILVLDLLDFDVGQCRGPGRLDLDPEIRRSHGPSNAGLVMIDPGEVDFVGRRLPQACYERPATTGLLCSGTGLEVGTFRCPADADALSWHRAKKMPTARQEEIKSMHTKTIAHQFGISGRVLERNLDGVSHQESLINPQPGGSCLNWLLGHLTRSRNQALALFGQKPMFPSEEFDPYDDNGGKPFRPETAVAFDELKRRFTALQEPLVNGLNGLAPEAMDRPAPFSPTGSPNETVGSLLVSLAFHEAYHVGQTGILRRIVGREGVIKPPRIPVAR